MNAAGPTPAERVQRALHAAREENRATAAGTVRGLVGIAIEATGLAAAVGDVCSIDTAEGQRLAQVTGFRDGCTTLMALTDQAGIAPRQTVTNDRRPLRVPVGSELLGRVVDALGRPLDGGPPIMAPRRAATRGGAPAALSRRPIEAQFATGVAAIDGFATCGAGQRLGVFAGSGVGKSTLMGMVARGSSADVNVIALVGERGREVREFVDDVLGEAGLAKSVVVVATSDAPPMQRLLAPGVAVTIAESLRDLGHHVLFMLDSVTRFAGVAREVGLAAGEPPTLRGYPPSLFSLLPQWIERLGPAEHGVITGLLTVLVDGDDFNEPVADAVRGYLDGHVVLSRAVASRGLFPAVDVLASISRLMPRLVSAEHQEAARGVRTLLAHYEEHRDLIQVGAYRPGSDRLLDLAVDQRAELERWLHHGDRPAPMAETAARIAQLGALVRTLG